MTATTTTQTGSPAGTTERRQRVFSGIQPSGNFHLGNYLGAIRNWANQQYQYESIFCIVDLHALSLDITRESMMQNITSVANTVLAAGVDPEHCIFFVQSDVHEHAELCWILQSVTRFGELRRMTQFKDKSGGEEEGVSAALFTYPVLQAADIVLYDTHLVPVGADQRQHIELTRDIAYRFNQRFGQTFVLPQADIKEHGARIMSLDDASKKMSKSSSNAGSYIAMLDAPDVIRKKISRAVTDSGREVKFDPQNKPEVSNLISIYAECSDKTIAEIEAQYEGQGYGPFKKDLAEAVVATLEPIQIRYHEIRQSGELYEVLKQGKERAAVQADAMLKQVKEKMGFIVL